jgi:hypothetical protein
MLEKQHPRGNVKRFFTPTGPKTKTNRSGKRSVKQQHKKFGQNFYESDQGVKHWSQFNDSITRFLNNNRRIGINNKKIYPI